MLVVLVAAGPGRPVDWRARTAPIDWPHPFIDLASDLHRAGAARRLRMVLLGHGVCDEDGVDIIRCTARGRRGAVCHHRSDPKGASGDGRR